MLVAHKGTKGEGSAHPKAGRFLAENRVDTGSNKSVFTAVKTTFFRCKLRIRSLSRRYPSFLAGTGTDSGCNSQKSKFPYQNCTMVKVCQKKFRQKYSLYFPS